MAEHSEQVAEHSEQARLKKDPVSISICEMLDFSPKSPDEPYITKVPNYLRKVNEEAYEPLVISIGPYHRGKPRLQAMEQQKIHFLQKLLEEKGTHVSVYVKEMRDLKDKALECYNADLPNELDSDDFVKMLLLDGVFLVQLIRLNLDESALPANLYPLGFMVYCYSPGLFAAFSRDILLVENQLPYFVLWRLFCMIESTADKGEFTKAIFRMLKFTVPGKVRPEDDLQKYLGSDFKHLLDLTYHCCWHPSALEMEAREENLRDDLNSSRLYSKNLLSSWYNNCCHPSTSDPENNKLKFIRCATELKEAGIKFKLFEEGESMFDIRFENGTLHIPRIKIGDYSERFLRNLIAYEQILSRARRNVMHDTDYAIFMDCLINSPKDVEILCREEIIVNYLGDDIAVARMINDLGAFVIHDLDNFYYTEIFRKVNRHCNKRWNRRMANLKHNYFNSPWTSISVLAAAMLLLLTLLQTVFTVIF